MRLKRRPGRSQRPLPSVTRAASSSRTRPSLLRVSARSRASRGALDKAQNIHCSLLNRVVTLSMSAQFGRTHMQTRGAIMLALLAGMGLGAIAVRGLHAQASPPAFLIFDAEIKDHSRKPQPEKCNRRVASSSWQEPPQRCFPAAVHRPIAFP
jgi:hypothetical protein